MTRRSPVVSAITRGPEIEMNAEDMAEEGFAEGMRVRLVSEQGSAEAKVRASPTLPRGVLFTTFHYAELPVNVLTPPTLDPQTRTPAYKDARVRVERLPAGDPT
jgi:predicted molibdopterin-dependent oxidoreductase YjgC